MNTKPRKRKCAHCRELFQPWNTLQRACSPSCALKLAAEKEEKRLRQWRRKERERLKTKSDWMKEAQAAFNGWIRERDKHLPCISCGATEQQTSYLKISGWVASHYRSVGACPELRFDERNVNRACVRCNSHLSGNIVEYRIGLIERYGEGVVAYLEGPQEPKKYTIDDLREIRDTYRLKARELKRAA